MCSDSMPPMPVPWVEATSAGWTACISSAGVKPAETNASTAVTKFHTAMRSMLSTICAGIPQAAGSKSSGICPATVRVKVALRGSAAFAPARRVTLHSPSTLRTTVLAGSASS